MANPDAAQLCSGGASISVTSHIALHFLMSLSDRQYHDRHEVQNVECQIDHVLPQQVILRFRAL
jgi:hypothetical protein